MLKVFKWLWDKAWSAGEQKVLATAHNLALYHQQKAEVTSLRDMYCPGTDAQKDIEWLPKLTSAEHSAVSSAMFNLIAMFDEDDKQDD